MEVQVEEVVEEGKANSFEEKRRREREISLQRPKGHKAKAATQH